MPERTHLTPGPFYEDAEGNPQDQKLHAGMLANEDANTLWELSLIEAEIARGEPMAVACELYATDRTLQVLEAEGRITIDRAPK